MPEKFVKNQLLIGRTLFLITIIMKLHLYGQESASEISNRLVNSSMNILTKRPICYERTDRPTLIVGKRRSQQGLCKCSPVFRGGKDIIRMGNL